jgi:ATP-dependent helicase HrpA
VSDEINFDQLMREASARLDNVLRRDRFRLDKLLRNARQRRDIAAVEAALAAIRQSENKCALRRSLLPSPTFDDSLPISQKRDVIASSLAQHQVLVVCGETGSGKTTQLPKICLSLGRGVAGTIGHTQPRRIAARSVAERIAAELQQPIGQCVGYKVRFNEQVGANTLIKVMTDGILLAETQHDRFLDQYDTLIIDEAHERSLNIDFILGYLKRLLPKRPDLKVIITSATIDPETLSRHFDDAPIIEVSGRTYPVEIRYSPPQEGENDDWVWDVVNAVERLQAEAPGDCLVFLTGEREIREATQALQHRFNDRLDILPLYSRLGIQEQQRIFSRGARPRVVLATNVAETSLTVPGIRYVIDSGLARIKRYSFRSKVERLPIEKISQASARQRAGRCGRISAGVCVRLYDEADLLARPMFTDPEIRRSNLAAVILQMLVLGLGDIEAFPFLEAPDRRYVNDGFRLLMELGALDDLRKLTTVGRQCARLPVDPRLGRTLVAAAHEGSLREVLVITSGLSIQDPRERPLERAAAADAAHRAFWDEKSDFAAYLKLWTIFHEQSAIQSRTQIKQWCSKNFISYRRMREWQEVHAQLVELVEELTLRTNEKEASYDAIHRALLSGFLSHIAQRQEEREFMGARGIKPSIFPGSCLAKKPPRWFFAAEFVETQKLYARYCAQFDPRWIERIGAHLIKRQYHEPLWDAKAGQVVAREQITLLGLTIAAGRLVPYGKVDPMVSRELFIRHALMGGASPRGDATVDANRQQISSVEILEAKSRRRDILVDEETLYHFYHERVPQEVVTWQDFEQWRKQCPKGDGDPLRFALETLMRHDASNVNESQFPNAMTVAGNVFPLSYRFEPAAQDDGVTLTIPLSLINQLEEQQLAWLVPGMLKEKMVSLIKALPKTLRKHFVPVPEFAAAALARLSFGQGDLLQQLGEALFRIAGVAIERSQWSLVDLPMHLWMNVRVVGENGDILAEGRNIDQLRLHLGGHVESHLAALPDHHWTQTELTRWSFGALPASVEMTDNGFRVLGYPALIDEGATVGLRLKDDADSAQEETRRALVRLYQLELSTQHKYLRKNIPQIAALAMFYLSVDKQAALIDDVLWCLFRATFVDDFSIPREEQEFRDRLEAGRGELVEKCNLISSMLMATLQPFHGLQSILAKPAPKGFELAYQDMRAQLNGLIYAGFLRTLPLVWLKRMPVYMKAMERRMAKLREGVARDAGRQAEIEPFLKKLSDPRVASASQPLRWLVEELRVSLFAQDLGTIQPISAQRLREIFAREGVV